MVTDNHGCSTDVATVYLTEPTRDDWSITGSAGTSPSANFIGTTDNVDFVFRTNNVERMRIKNNGITEFSNSIKIDASSTDNLRSVYVDQNGMLKVLPVFSPLSPCNGAVAPAWEHLFSPLTLFTCPQISVGIGTYAPAANFHVIGNSVFSGSSGANNSSAAIQGNDNASSASNPEYTWWNNTSTGLFHPSSNVIGFSTAATERMRIDPNGNVGIGTASPVQTLDVNGRVYVEKGIIQKDGPPITASNATDLGLYSLGSTWMRLVTNHQPIRFFTDANTTSNLTGSTAVMTIESTGIVGIGLIPDPLSTSKLQVEGTIAAREVKVTTGPFPDFVFESNYNLRSVKELENYISLNKHLPEIPSSKEVASNNGIELGDMQTKLLQKIEELTLYMIAQDKKIEELQKEIKNQK